MKINITQTYSLISRHTFY